MPTACAPPLFHEEVPHSARSTGKGLPLLSLLCCLAGVVLLSVGPGSRSEGGQHLALWKYVQQAKPPSFMRPAMLLQSRHPVLSQQFFQPAAATSSDAAAADVAAALRQLARSMGTTRRAVVKAAAAALGSAWGLGASASVLEVDGSLTDLHTPYAKEGAL